MCVVVGGRRTSKDTARPVVRRESCDTANARRWDNYRRSALFVQRRAPCRPMSVSECGLCRRSKHMWDDSFRWLSLLCRSEGKFSGNSTQKDHREHCKTLWWRCWFGGGESLVVVTPLVPRTCIARYSQRWQTLHPATSETRPYIKLSDVWLVLPPVKLHET